MLVVFEAGEMAGEAKSMDKERVHECARLHARMTRGRQRPPFAMTSGKPSILIGLPVR